MAIEKNREFYLKDARNIVWGLAFIGFLPLFILVVMAITNPKDIKVDGVTIGLALYSLVISSLAFYAGKLCGQGIKKGKNLAIVP